MQILEFLKAKDKALSETTRHAYQNHLDLLNRFIKGEEPTQPEIIAHLNSFNAPSTLQAHKSAIIRYWEWRYPETNEYGQPVHPLIFPRDTFAPEHKRLFKLASVQVAIQLIDACTDPDDKFFFQCLFQLGIRIRELLKVKVSDLVDDGIYLIAKGGDERKVPAPAACLVALKVHGIDKKGTIFTKSYDHYYNLVKRLGADIGYPDISPHYFRHAYTVNLLHKGMVVTDVADARGDKNLNTVFKYSHLMSKELQQQIEKANR